MFFPKASTFRVALEGMANREHVGLIDSVAEFVFVPFGIGIINGYESRVFWGW